MALFSGGGAICCKGFSVDAAEFSSRHNGVAISVFSAATKKATGFGISRISCLKPCQASLFHDELGLSQALQSSDARQPLTVFRDEAKGIVCYRTSSGEITCEGIDEGPHFHPPLQYLRFQFPQHTLSTKSRDDEVYVNGAGI